MSEEKKVAPEELAVALLMEKKWHIVTAESCTGGLVASRIVNVPGVSGVFDQGFITYANEAKEELLGVNKQTLMQYGAVSEQTAEEMVRGAAGRTGAQVAISVTGIAGPDGGTAKKPVGLVYIGCLTPETIVVREYHFEGSRQKVREAAATAALLQLVECLSGGKTEGMKEWKTEID